MGGGNSWCVDSGIYIYIYIYFSFPLGGGFMESGTQPTRPNFPCLLRILYEASTVGTECAPSMWPPCNSSGLGVTIVLLTPWFWSCPESNSPSGLGVTPSVTPRCGRYTHTPGLTPPEPRSRQGYFTMCFAGVCIRHIALYLVK